MAIRNMMRILSLVLLISYAVGFAPSANHRENVLKIFSATSDASAVSEKTMADTFLPPSWEELSAALDERNTKNETPKVTLYRDTNGWCPFCERVWVALRAKGISYDETLVSLQNKPEWYKQLVPTTLVPAVLFHEEDDNVKQRRIVWESKDILHALDEAFPDTPRLMWDTPEFQEAQDSFDELSSAGFQFLYAGRNDTLTDEDIEERRIKFQEQLDKLDNALEESKGPFRLGNDFSGMDAIMIPTLERWRFQLPITAEFDILENRPHLQDWFSTIDSYAPYSHRVAGDRYSWTAVASQFMRYFGGGEDKPDVAAAIQRADDAAAKLSESFAEQAETIESDPAFAIEAATKLVANHEAVVKDCTRKEPLSQKHIPRASNEQVASQVLRCVASILVESSEAALDAARTAPLFEITDTGEGALVARTVACRLCAPRDMSAPAAALLRGVLATVASRLDG